MQHCSEDKRAGVGGRRIECLCVCVCVYISEDKRAGVAGRGVKCLHHSLVFVCVCCTNSEKSVACYREHF